MICETTDGTALAAGTAGLATFQVPRGVAPAVIVGVALLLYLPGLRWGLPATSSWSQDTIAAIRTLGALEGWPEQWKARYPPFHFLVLGAAYQPVLRHWERTGQLTVNERTGRITLGPPHAPKVGLLILIARAITACMALAAGLGLWAATLRFARDDLGALLAAVCFMIGAAFTYFAHLGNVDVPSMCWFAWSLFFFARAIDSRSWVDCLLLGTCASLAACTKDAVAAAYPGMALILLAGEIQRRRKSSPWSRSIVSSICQYQWLIGLAAFVIPFAVINGWLVDPGVYITRMRQWLTPPTGSTLAGEYRYPDQLGLLWASLRQAAGGVGWPMLAAMIASVAWALKFRRRLAWVVLVPALTYYVIVIARISFVYARFLFPVLVLFCVLTGVAAASFWRRHATPPTVRLVVCCAVLLPSIGYAVAIDAEMLTDSRYDVEAWFAQNVDGHAEVGAFSKPQYLPRLSELGWPTYAVVMARESFEQPQPEYLVLTNYNYEDFDTAAQACMRDLLAGRLGYRPIAAFHGRFLGTGSSWLSLAGWGAPVPGKISPTVTVLRRAEDRHQ